MNQASLYVYGAVSTAGVGHLSVIIYQDAASMPNVAQEVCKKEYSAFSLDVHTSEWKNFSLPSCVLQPGTYWLAFEKRAAAGDATSGTYLGLAPSPSISKSAVLSSVA